MVTLIARAVTSACISLVMSVMVPNITGLSRQPGGWSGVSGAEERGDGRDEPAGIVEPGVVACTWLDSKLGRGEQAGELGNHLRRPLQVEASRKHQHRRAERGERGAGGRRVKRAFGGE